MKRKLHVIVEVDVDTLVNAGGIVREPSFQRIANSLRTQVAALPPFDGVKLRLQRVELPSLDAGGIPMSVEWRLP
jgi:hypothetical protein